MAWNSMELTAGEDEVALVVVQGVEAKLHRLAHNRDVAPDNKSILCSLLDIFESIPSY